MKVIAKWWMDSSTWEFFDPEDESGNMILDMWNAHLIDLPDEIKQEYKNHLDALQKLNQKIFDIVDSSDASE
jgi:hypothetical protein